MHMDKKLSKKATLLLTALALGMLVSCGSPASQTSQEVPASQPAATPTAALLTPGEPGAPTRSIRDMDSSLKAAEKRAVTGDKFLDNLYERPFTSKEMLYLPDIDINFATITSDDQFHYFSILLQAVSDGSMPGGMYGVEFDRNLTGRGDLLVLAEQLTTAWSTAGVKAYIDKNQDVGGSKPVDGETGFSGDGYESQLMFEGNKVAYVRFITADNPIVQFAVSRALLEDPEKFLWGVWADRAMQNPARMDYNDVFSRRQAGSPIKDSEFYPLNELHSIDNTCRLPYGFDATFGYKGICLSVPVPKEGGGCPWPVTCIVVGQYRLCYCIDPSEPIN